MNVHSSQLASPKNLEQKYGYKAALHCQFNRWRRLIIKNQLIHIPQLVKEQRNVLRRSYRVLTKEMMITKW